MSFLPSPASASAPWAHSACSWNNDLSSALRVGCSKIPTILALPLMLIGGWSSPWRLAYVMVPNGIPSHARGPSRLRAGALRQAASQLILVKLTNPQQTTDPGDYERDRKSLRGQDPSIAAG